VAKQVNRPLVLNSEQQAAVDAGAGVFCVMAGPGAGKSACLVARYARLIHDGVSPNDILNLTFTNSAAKTMRDRAEAAAGVQIMDRIAGFSTFHSLALRFCEQERLNFPFELAEDFLCLEPQANKIAWEVGKRFEVDSRQLRQYVSLCKRQRIGATRAVKIAERDGKNEKLALAYKQYERALREKGLLDFDSLVLEMFNLMQSNDNVRSRWTYLHVQLDESQDLDDLQWSLVQLLYTTGGSLYAVGDGGQNLYNFRGASDTFLHMDRLFPDVQTLFLGQNFRSSPQVVEMCRKFGPVPMLAEKFFTTNPDGPVPDVIGYPSSVAEADAILKSVQKMDEKKISATVLARTNRALRQIEDTLSGAGVKYHILGRSGFYSQPEVKTVLAYLGCALSFNDGNILTALRGPLWPSKFIKKVEVLSSVKARQKDDPNKPPALKLLSEYRGDAQQVKAVSGFVQFIYGLTRYRSQPATQALKSVIQDLKAFDFYEEYETPDNSPRENLQELIRLSQRFSTLGDFLAYTRRATAASKGKRGVALATIHSAKGLEWDTVFVIAVQDGILPHAKSEDLMSEKNAFFVAVSRAKRNLRISYAGAPSIFLKDLIEHEEPA